MSLINELLIGTSSSYNNMTVYRKFDGTKGFQTCFNFVDDNTLTDDSHIVVNYIQYYKNSENEILDRLTEYMFYIVPNSPSYPAASGWFNNLARTPMVGNGVVDSIEYTLLNLPIDVENGYTLVGA